jgi:hypothetical protein
VDLHLSCYELDGEWWVDLDQPFGSVVAEWSYDCLGEVMRWAMSCLDVCPVNSPLCRYVDNFFHFAARDDSSANERWGRCTSLLAATGVDFCMKSKTLMMVRCLPSEWESAAFVCPAPKYAIQLRLIMSA